MAARKRDTAWEGLAHLVRHPLRSLLTAFTSAVAIAVTVNVISLVYGLDEDLRRDLERFGTRTIDVGRVPVLRPGSERRPLGPAQVAEVRRLLEDLDAVVAPRRQRAGVVRGAASVDRMAVVAVPPDYLATLDVPLLAGRWLAAADAGEGVCVLDESAAASLFPDTAPEEAVDQTVTISIGEAEERRRVVGVLDDPMTYRELFETFDEGRGARTLTSALLSFRNVYVPSGALGEGEYAGMSIALPSAGVVDEAARRLAELYPLAAQDPSEAIARSDVVVFVRKTWMEVLGTQSQTGAFLGNIVWIIIVLVAVVMITTLNLLTIRERYDELAIRRVEGARRRDVALQVTVEGTVTALVGGLGGLPLGYVGASILRQIVDFPFRFDPRYAAIATAVAIVLGLLSSVLPARRAASLEPTRVLHRRLT